MDCFTKNNATVLLSDVLRGATVLSCVRALIVVSLQKALSHNRGYATDPSLAGPLASPPHRVPISLIAGEEWEVLGRPRARIDEMRQAQRHESMFQMRLAMPRRCVPPPSRRMLTVCCVGLVDLWARMESPAPSRQSARFRSSRQSICTSEWQRRKPTGTF